MSAFRRATTWVLAVGFAVLTAWLPGLHTCGARCHHAAPAVAVKKLDLAALHAPRDFRAAASATPLVLLPASPESTCLACKLVRVVQTDGAVMTFDFAGHSLAELSIPAPESPAAQLLVTPISPRAPPVVSL